MHNFELKPALAAIRSFSKSEDAQNSAIKKAIKAGLRSEWLAPSEVQFARKGLEVGFSRPAAALCDLVAFEVGLVLQDLDESHGCLVRTL